MSFVACVEVVVLRNTYISLGVVYGQSALVHGIFQNMASLVVLEHIASLVQSLVDLVRTQPSKTMPLRQLSCQVKVLLQLTC